MYDNRHHMGILGKRRILRIRSMFGGLAARIADPAQARRVEAELNDAWLRLQFARVANDPDRVLAERRVCVSLLEQARQRAIAPAGSRRGAA
ncbi:hypothetical protein [Rubellimicrobium arenae]|uniref:hypothetical protein n=1 Tax=Rubellimicrobium arenae TaxID=2817372 RepID=UPI001B30D8D1|nr:hypothetical protein [Rubellimicrobium arenae]